MRRSVMRVLVALGVVAAGGLTWTDSAGASGHDINVTGDAAKCDKTWGPPCFTPANGTVTPVAVGDTVTWHVVDGTHTVTPVDPAAFTGSGDLTGPGGTFSVTFDKPGTFAFYCKHHGSVDKDGKTFHGMWGKIDVKGGDTTTSSAPPANAGPPPDGSPPPGKADPGPANPPSSPPSSGSPPPSSGGSGGSGRSGGSGGGNGQSATETGRPWVGPPIPAPPPPAPPSTRTASGSAPAPGPAQASSPQPQQGRGREGGAGNAATTGATWVPPDEAVLPPIPAFTTPTTAPPANPPGGVPQGDAIAVLKHEGAGQHRKLILIGTGLGMGAFAFGVGGWKYAHRASKYWPA